MGAVFVGASALNARIAALESSGGASSAGNVGQIEKYASAVAPAGTLICDGSEVLRADYPLLWEFAKNSGNLVPQSYKSFRFGSFGEGDGSTTFSIPDHRGVFARGVDLGANRDKGFRLQGAYQRDIANHSQVHELVNYGYIKGNRFINRIGTEATGDSAAAIAEGAINRTVFATKTALGFGSDEAIIGDGAGFSDTELRVKNVNFLYCIRYE
ncbi:tail fiber protein [Marinomonas agarivorans]|nr:tail fiber protein [Marinomonas agarivorans]